MAHSQESDLPVIADLHEFDFSSGTFLERLVFNHRPVVMILCLITTLVLGYQATKIQLQAALPTYPIGRSICTVVVIASVNQAKVPGVGLQRD